MPEINGKVKLTNVRLSYPQLFRPKAFKPGDEPTYNGNFLLHKVEDAEQIMEIRRVMTAVAREKWGANIPKGLKLALRDGGEPGKEDVDGYGPDINFLSAASRKKIHVVDVDKTPLDESSGRPYAGCYVNVSLRFWAQDNEYGRRINAELLAVQYAMEGDAFGSGGTVDVDEEFEDLTGGAGTGSAAGAADDEGGGLLG